MKVKKSAPKSQILALRKFNPNIFSNKLKRNICVVPVAYLSYFSNPTLNIKMILGEKIPKLGTFSDFVTIFFVKCYNKI